VDQPQVNGDYYSFANLEIRMDGQFYLGFKSANYGIKVGAAYVRGTNQYPLGWSQGQVEPHLDIELYKPQWGTFLLIAGPGYLGRSYAITISYGNPFDNGDLITVTDEMPNSKLVSVEATNTEGIDATAMKLTFMPLDLLYNGIPALLNGLPQIGALG
jgi:hypothetical protein